MSTSAPESEPNSQRLLVTLCTYNERENIEVLLPEIRKYLPNAHILVVDDNSPDGTGDYVRKQQQHDPALHLLQRAGKLGLGTATVAAFNFAINQQYDWMINLDADFSHPPRYLPDLVAASAANDVVIGSRYVPGGSIEGWGPVRHFMSRGINVYARCLLGLKTKDNSGAFRCYRVSKLAEVDWSKSRAKGYAFQEELMFRLKQAGCRFAEVPIHFEERRFGQTKINWKEVVIAGLVLWRIRIESLFDR